MGKPVRYAQQETQAIPTLQNGIQGSQHTAPAPAKQRDETYRSREDYDEIEYLRLRMEKLKAFRGMSTDKLCEIYLSYKKSMLENVTISQRAIAYLKNLIAYTKRNKTEYCPEHLQVCYAYEFWLSNLIKIKTKPDFFISLRDHLRKERFLSEKQIIALNNERIKPKGIKEFQFEDFKFSPKYF
ncbi:hypothetical protein LWC08_03860 [Desulfobaculum bizertense]|uniref:hypothetical protein n=1 Tax=Desulfobaculum bizertense TaxID=376490 RepID=UPI001F3ECAF9|nr:hypothetical protein [Desulfobaculum bizertense]UIJ38714.1 hypothetical protein LWC08_03860 [Desulfobaculum bizertense]